MTSIYKIPADDLKSGNCFANLYFVFWVEANGTICYEEVKDRKEANFRKRQLQKRGVYHVNLREQRVGRTW